MKRIETNSLDPPKLKSIDKAKKIVEVLQHQRQYVLEEIAKMASAAGDSMVHILLQVQWSEKGRNPMWGMSGPAQGMRIEQISALSGRLYQIDETLEMIYEMWPKLKPAEEKEEKDV